ncbi:mitogen-activated kinase kinase kinase YODA-like [Olea europaea subsp. europaea]|uniref:Mitogen-activated kinase kinase kinase YODA-like n=1 Tax=Olea europaea subsp. europaea TaxID=158383 RepID=A0A8S0U7U7_OLEEU|nr:mitogen-activated kinase kinase kinase YODA-like [Olea europaea subsp. europaea]
MGSGLSCSLILEINGLGHSGRGLLEIENWVAQILLVDAIGLEEGDDFSADCKRAAVGEVVGSILDKWGKNRRFWLAKRAQGNKKRKLEPYWKGTPRYLAPEAIVDNVQQFPSDIWAFGCIVLEMLTGKPPWDGEKESNVEDILSKIKEGYKLPKFSSEIPKEARDFVKGCFVKKPMFRLTAKMLLNHTFLEGLDDNEDEAEEIEEVEDLSDIESIVLVYESEDELNSSLFQDYCSFDSGEDFFDYLSEEDVEDELVSHFDEGKSK